MIVRAVIPPRISRSAEQHVSCSCSIPGRRRKKAGTRVAGLRMLIHCLCEVTNRNKERELARSRVAERDSSHHVGNTGTGHSGNSDEAGGRVRSMDPAHSRAQERSNKQELVHNKQVLVRNRVPGSRARSRIGF